MAKLRFEGSLALRLSGFTILSGLAVGTRLRHLLGRRLDPSWDADFETGIRFWRRQFTRAMSGTGMARGRQILDSVQTETDDVYPVQTVACAEPRGRWYEPDARKTDAVALYLHGGGYAFHSAISGRFAAMLAHHGGIRLFAPDYRLTPEHPHPAQQEDALAAWDYVTSRTAPDRVVVIGDSAGGHMALMLLQSLRRAGREQPALCVGLCPWTDIGARGDSLHSNDRYDLVQGWMALRFGEMLDPDGTYGREALSPINHDFAGLAPLYLQAGGREVLRDMIRDFATVQAGNGADVMLDLWPDMPHDFQAYDSLRQSSREALSRIRKALEVHAGGQAPAPFVPMPGVTVIAAGKYGRAHG